MTTKPILDPTEAALLERLNDALAVLSDSFNDLYAARLLREFDAVGPEYQSWAGHLRAVEEAKRNWLAYVQARRYGVPVSRRQFQALANSHAAALRSVPALPAPDIHLTVDGLPEPVVVPAGLRAQVIEALEGTPALGFLKHLYDTGRIES